MNLLSLLLGHYDKDKAFYLYRLETSPTLFFKFADIASLFNLPIDLVHIIPHHVDKHNPHHTYVTTTDLAPLAIRHNKFLLAELCKLKPNDYVARLDESILSNLPRFVYHPSKKDESQYKPTPIKLVEALKVKSEPISPPSLSLHKHQHSDPMALDTMLIGAGSQQQTRRASRVFDEPNKKQKRDEPTLLPKPIHTVSSQQPQASSLLSKRLNSSKNARNLTIYAPSYGEQANGIQSAPLHSNFRQQITKPTQPHPLSQATMISPATSSATHSEFAIPPIVPSQQQQPPHTAHPSSRHHFPPPHSPQYAAFSHLSGRTAEPKTPTHGSLQRQQFMQPFEHLFDTIETTRTLKSTLDDQIRRSSALIQTLQASSTTVEGLIRNQMKELQKEVMHRMEDRLEDMYSRVSSLEKRMVGTTEEQEDNRRSQSTTPSRRLQESLISPPTIVRSQHDIGPQEYHHMLDALRERLDRLERQMES